MFCMNCQNDLVDCTCPDLKERLASLKNSPNLAIKWCKKCDNHYAQCKCAEPQFYITGMPEKKDKLN